MGEEDAQGDAGEVVELGWRLQVMRQAWVVLLMALEIDKKKAMERSTVIEGEDRGIGGCGVAKLRRLRGEGMLMEMIGSERGAADHRGD